MHQLVIVVVVVATRRRCGMVSDPWEDRRYMYCTVVVENDYQVYSSLRVFHTPCGSEPVPECQHDSSDTSHRAIISTSPRYYDGGAPIDGCQMVRGVHLVVAEFNSRATAATPRS